MMRGEFVVLLGLVGLLRLCVVWAEPATRVTAITDDDGHTVADVVAVVDSRGEVVCSAVVVAPRRLLTAAHCVGATDSDLFVATAPVINNESNFVPVDHVVLHPDFDPVTLNADVAVLFVDRLVSDSEFLLTAPTGDDLQIGTVVRVAGYGRTSASMNDAGVLRTGSAQVTEVAPSTFRHSPITCEGDSGGALFVEHEQGAVLVGIVSGGSPDCDRSARASRVSAYLDWLRSLSDSRFDPPADCSLAKRGSVGAPPFGGVLALMLACALRRGRRRDSRLRYCRSRGRWKSQALVW